VSQPTSECGYVVTAMLWPYFIFFILGPLYIDPGPGDNTGHV